MRLTLQNAADHAAAGIARTHLEEKSHAVGISLFDNLGVINSVQCLAEDHIGGAARSDPVALTKGAAVEGNPLRRSHGEGMQIAVCFCHLFGNFTMNRRHAAQREKMAIDFLNQCFHLLSIATNHTFPVSIDNQQVSLLLTDQCLFHLCCGHIDKTEYPVDLFTLFKTPDLTCRLAFTGEVLSEKRRFTESLRHAITILPGTKREEPC